ncbi:MAG: hypothetical protein IM607_12530 [Cytophagales bacterium]|jgi:hypothetical protein|nr:hypothetical protein [Cytophagales bacterium]
MAKKTITVEIQAENPADFATIEKALNVYAKTFSAKEHDKLRMIILYDQHTMGLLRGKLNT